MIREGTRRRHRGQRLAFGLATLAAIVCVTVTVACAGPTGVASQKDAPPVIQVASSAQVVLLPNHLRAGIGGWCLTTVDAGGSGCPTYRLPTRLGPFAGPIVVEFWTSRSPPPVNEAIILTTAEVAAVSVEGGPPLRTHADPLLPDNMRAAVVELRGGSARQVLGISTPPPLPRSYVAALNSKGESIPQTRVHGAPLEFQVPRRSWGPLQRAPRGVCELLASGLVGLASQGGSVMTTVAPHTDVRGREFVDCVHRTYTVAHAPVEANLLVDAAHPGSTPPGLPAMRPWSSHPGTFEGPGIHGDELARRIPGAWLLIAEGKDSRERLALLEHLLPRIHFAP